MCVDLATDEFDVEPMKDKDAKTVLKSLLTMFKCNFIKKPKYSFATDSGSEFKGVFHHRGCADGASSYGVVCPRPSPPPASGGSLLWVSVTTGAPGQGSQSFVSGGRTASGTAFSSAKSPCQWQGLSKGKPVARNL